MKILLIGDYSGVHLELRNALTAMGHNVVLCSDGDSYKSIRADILIKEEKESIYKTIRKLNLFLYLSGFTGIITYLRNRSVFSDFKEFDVAQFINPIGIPAFGPIGNLLLFLKLKNSVKLITCCALGDDPFWVYSCLTRKYKYSALDGFISKPWRVHKYIYSLKYIFSPAFLLTSIFIEKYSDLIIAGLDDYAMARKKGGSNLRFIRIPIFRDNFVEPSKTTYPITIFHGWQTGKDERKGNRLMDEAAMKCIRKYGDKKVIYQRVGGVPYDEYVTSYKGCDIYLDQVNSYDRGVSGALGMSAGKVVFSGFENAPRLRFDAPESIRSIGVNATPDCELLYASLCYLIENLDVLDAIKNAAFDYAKCNYDAEKVADEYIQTWRSKIALNSRDQNCI